MQLPAPIRAPTFLSRRRLFEQKLADLHKCTDLNQLKQLHALIYKSNLHKDPFIAPKLISALSLCQQMTLAINVFDQIQNPNAFLCNTLIKAYIRNSEPDKAFEVFREMRWSGIFPDNYTYLFLIKACSGLQSVKMIHAHVEKYNLYSDLFVPNSLIDAYSKCGLMGVKAAKVVFDVMEERDVVTYNSMISGLVKAGELTQAKKLFDGMPHRDRVSWNAILDGYVKAGEMSAAFQIFEKMPSRDVVSWSTVISGYAKTGDIEMAKGLAKEAARLYDRMEEARLKPDDATFVSILSASAESGLLGLGKKVHQSILRRHGAYLVQWKEKMVTWNAMIHGLAMHGHGRKALQLFDRMKQEGFAPDKVTFVGVLAACSQCNDGIHHFYSMENDYGIAPEIEHYGCLIDLLGRGGRLSEAFRLLHNMPFEPNVVIWSSLLRACRMHNAVQLAEEVLHQLVKLEPAGPGNFSMLSNIYAAAGDWGSVSNARLQIRNIDSKRPSGVSLIELNDEFHEFTVMIQLTLNQTEIYQTIKGLNQHLTKIPYAPSIAI
ncbi:Pentatricopeptide repeat-containing protein [Sesamum angolense]|uniref:Pentatricopeptide repeat-containing protein n=1 Tax=Sesamum angolense TaxID=2727404 RepID=A0AAE1WGX3_9LAMI|nr:Pentatricopeptide repeat-containing protein [Sesamum angolense]